MLIGYARTSTLDQVAGYEAQRQELEAAGCERLFCEQVSSVADRPQLAAAIDYVRPGDVLIVTKLDRLARSLADLLQIMQSLHRRGGHLKVLNLGDIDPESPTGLLIFNMLGSLAQFERGMMLERQRDGIARAKADGKYAKNGRPATARAQADEVRRLAAEGLGKVAIAKRLGLNRSSVYRILAG